MADSTQSFDRFETIRLLGKGGMGTVYLARDLRLGRQVALKVLNSEDLASDERRSRFLREARAAASIRHPNVATIYEVDETEDGQPYIVMEFCEGETLSQRMRRRPLDTAEFLNIARQIASGLAAAHATGIIHRDIKTANIIIEPTGVAKILDFGLAKFLQQELAMKQTFESTSGHFFGTLHYLAPEQARGQQADARSDLFAVGVVLYQMASGHLPFNADSPLMTIEKIRDAEPEKFTAIDPSFPVSATRVIAKLLQKDPADRYQSAAELLDDLAEIETPTLRYNATSRSQLGRTVRRPPWTKLALIVAAFVAGAAALYFIRQRGDAKPELDVPAQTSTAAGGPIRSMAVLPFDNVANNQQDDFLSVGLADALVTKLQKIPSMQVRPTSAVLQFHNLKVDAKTASQKLGVDGLLEGHFLAAGDLVRINLQLTDARTGYSVWADTIDGKRGDLLGLIDDVSSRTVAALNQKIGIQQPSQHASEPRSENAKAFEEFLKARASAGSFSPADFAMHVNHLKRAIELDPAFAGAYADLAIAVAIGHARGMITDPAALEKAEWYARQAVRIDPNLAQAHLALGRVFVRLPGRFREAQRENLAALRLDPNEPQAVWVLATYFVATGDLQKVPCPEDRMVRLDPASNEAKTRGYLNINAIDPEGALDAAKYALASKDTEIAGHDIRGYAFILLGNLPGAEREADAAAAMNPKSYLGKSLRAMIAAARGDRPAAEAFIKSFDDDANHNHWAALRVVLCYARLGDNAKAIEWLHKAYDGGQHSWYALVKHPWLQPLQTDPEFQKIVTAIKTDLDDVRDDVIGVNQLICK